MYLSWMSNCLNLLKVIKFRCWLWMNLRCIYVELYDFKGKSPWDKYDIYIFLGDRQCLDPPNFLFFVLMSCNNL